jgi:hypothetical protein
MVPAAYAAQPSIQENTLSILNHVAGIKPDLDAVDQSTQKDSQYLGLSQTQTDLYLSSEQGKIRAQCSYVNNQLHEIYLSDIQGQVFLKQSSGSTVDLAKNFLAEFNYTQDTFYSQLVATLNSIDTKTNLTKTEGNIQLKTSIAGAVDNYIWTYVDESGVKADRKNVVLSYENGQLKCFLNNWPLYTVIGAPKVSVEQARTIAIEASKDFSYQVTYENGTVETVSDLKTASESLGYESLVYLNYDNQDDARGGDPFMLYPAWFVPLGLDDFYPGGVSSIMVLVWADMGEVSAIHEITADSNIVPAICKEASANQQTVDVVANQSTVFPPALALVAVFSLAVIPLVAVLKVKSRTGRRSYSRFWATLGLMMLLFSMVFLAVPSVSADTVTLKSRVYSCENGSGYRNPAADSFERDATIEVCNYIAGLTQGAGYDTSNWRGGSTTVSSVVDYVGSDEQNYDRTILFHVGHFSYMGRAYQDNTGNPIYDTAIYPNTGLGKHYFTFLWVCGQAEVPIINGKAQWADYPTNTLPGMPIAWTHRDGISGRSYMNAYGYTSPDYQGQCFISFYGYSPMLSGLPINTFLENSTFTNCKEFIKKFYSYSFIYHLSVQDALNQASLYHFGIPFVECCLYTGYNCYWPGGDWDGVEGMEYMSEPGYSPTDYAQWVGGRGNNCMRVFGDSSIKLNPQTPPSAPLHDLWIYAETGGTTNPEPGGYGCAGETVDILAIPYADYVFDHWIKDGNVYDYHTENPISVDMYDGDHTVTAYFRYTTAQRLAITASGGGTTSGFEPGVHWVTYGTDCLVTAQGAGFSYWLLDGEYVYTGGSINVHMEGYHTLEAHFNENLPACSLTVTAYEYMTSAQVPTNIYVNHVCIGTADGTYSVPLGTIRIYVDAWVYVPGVGDSSAWYTEVDGQYYQYSFDVELTTWALHRTITFVYIYQ